MNHKIYLIVATDLKGGMGFKGKLPWNLPGDMAFFKRQTIQTEDCQLRNMVVMGRTTWESIPEKHRPLEGRKNVVLSRNKDLKAEGAEVVGSLEQAFALADERVDDIYVIGGAKVFDQIMKGRRVNGIYLTRIKKEFQCDVFFPKINSFGEVKKLKTGSDDGIEYEFLLYTRKRSGGKAKRN